MGCQVKNITVGWVHINIVKVIASPQILPAKYQGPTLAGICAFVNLPNQTAALTAGKINICWVARIYFYIINNQGSRNTSVGISPAVSTIRALINAAVIRPGIKNCAVLGANR